MTLNLDANTIYDEVVSENPLSPNVHMIHVELPRWLYLEVWNSWEHDMALIAGVSLRRHTARQMGRLLPRIPENKEALDYYRHCDDYDTEWLDEVSGNGQDTVVVVIPILHHLLVVLDKWEHWDLVALGQYMERVVTRMFESLGDGELKELRAEWQLAYPDCA